MVSLGMANKHLKKQKKINADYEMFTKIINIVVIESN